MPFIEKHAGLCAIRVSVGALAAVALLAGGPSVSRAGTAPLLLAQATAPRAPAAPAAPTTGQPPAVGGQGSGAAAATEAKTETVEQRITELHGALKITPAQEPKWQAVANAMRQNAAAMDKLAAETQAMDPGKMTAVQDLVTYTKFAQAHVAGLKNLTDDFRALYASMPADQKKLADQVFRSSGE